MDASKGFIKDGNKNRLRAQDIHLIVDAFPRQLELPRYSRMVRSPRSANPKNDFNLNLPRYIDSSEPEAKATQEDLTAKVIEKYGELTENDIKALVVDDKWLATLEGTVQGELDRVSQTLTSRIRELAERYAPPTAAAHH